MAYQATLNFEGKEFDVLRCNYSIGRSVDAKGLPVSRLYGAMATIEIEATADTTIFEHMASQLKSCNGTITFKKDEVALMKELSWNNGYIIEYKGNKPNAPGDPLTVGFTVSAQMLIIGDATLTQNWPETS